MDKKNKVLVLSTIVLIGFFIAIVYHYLLGVYLELPYPYNTFLFRPEVRFNDFVLQLSAAHNFEPYKTPALWINYFPLAYVLLFPFSLIKSPLVAYFIFASGFLTCFTYINIKVFRCEFLTKIENFKNIFILTILTYPILFALDKGTFDMFLLILFAGFAYAFLKEKYLLSAILLALQNAINPFAILFLSLFLFKKKYKELFLSIILTGLMIVGGFMVLKGEFFNQIVTLIQSVKVYGAISTFNLNDIDTTLYSSSLFTALKFIFCKFYPALSISQLIKIYNDLCLIIIPITIFFAWKEKTFWKQITMLTSLMLFVPYLVWDYKLIFLFVPIWLFANAENKTNFDLSYAIIFGLLLIPKKIIISIVSSLGITQSCSLGLLSNPLLLFLLSAIIIYEQFLKKKESE